MPNAYIVDAVRTAGGRRNGRLSNWHPGDLGATVIDAIVDRSGVAPDAIDDVIFGCVSQIGAQAANLARYSVLASKLPESVPGTTVDRQCGSSQQAVHFAAQAVMSGTQDIVIAGGVEVMSLVPIGASVMDGMGNDRGDPMSEGIRKRYPDVSQFSQFDGAEIVAKRYDITRQDMENFAEMSHKRAAEATAKGYFKNEIIPVKGLNKKTGEEVVHDTDEGIRPGTTAEKLGKLKTLRDDGRITAGTASQICDGASAVLIVNEAGLRKLGPGVKPRARIVAMSLAGDDPVTMLSAPIPATRKVLKLAGLSIDDIDLYELNEAFASVPLAWAKQVGAKLDKLNVNGGAMALGHPLGATGTKLFGTLLNELERRSLRYGLVAICEGGGTANATIIEVLPQSARAKL